MTIPPLRRPAPAPGPLLRALLCASLPAIALPAAAAPAPEPVVEGYYERWRTAASQLMQDAERRVFEALDDDVDREIFIRRFWQARAGVAGGGGLLSRWHQNFEEAVHRFDSLEEDRAQVLLLAGKPAGVVVFAGCHNVLRPLRIWTFGPRRVATAPGAAAPPAARGFHLVFYLEGGPEGSYRLWAAGGDPGPLMFSGPARHREWSIEELIDYAMAKGCFRWSRRDAGTFAAALRQALDPDALRRLTLPPAPDGGWLDRLAAELEEPGLPGGPLEIDFPGRYQMKTVVHGRVAVPAAEVERNAEGLLFDRITLAGDVKLGDRLVDAFRVVHLVAGSRAAGDRVGLDFYRRLRPADYTLDLRVEDADGLGLLRETRPLKVPRLEHEAPEPAGHRLGLPGLTRREVGVLTTFPGVEILPPGAEPLAGDVEIEAVTTGGPIERVEFALDGEVAARAGEPPWAAVLALGDEPRRRRVEAVAYDPLGRELARGERILNAHPARFAVRVAETPRGSGGRRAKIEVDVPGGEVLAAVELYVGEERIAAWSGPPWSGPPFEHPLPDERPLPERPPGATRYVRAVATLAGGETVEDLVFVDARDAVERIDVQLVELYASVHDGQGRFVTGLRQEDFRVLEDGVEQALRRFDTVENLAINVALLMDVSASMRQKIDVATKSAQRFFQTVLTPRDRASLLTFNHDVRRVVPFTNDALDLGYGASGFRAWGTTRLYDSVVYAVLSFGGLEGKRALVLLSDGQDVDSDFYFKQVLDTTLRSGVAVYPIALGVEDPQTVTDLMRLADESGGRFFQIAGVSQLDGIYRRIEQELRSQYLLVYEPPAAGRRGFRRVEVEVLAEGLQARSISGYYP